MGIEVVHHYDHLCSIGIVFFEDLLHEKCPILLGPVFGHFQQSLASERLISNEQVGATLLLIGVVFSCNLSRRGLVREDTCL